MKIEFSLPGLPKRTNNMGGHWRHKQTEAHKWKERVVNHLRLSRLIPPQPFKHARLTLTRYSSSRPDYDGLVSSFKHCIDGLIEAGVIENDTPENIGVPEYRWRKESMRNGHIKISITPCDKIALKSPTFDQDND